jgi:hypothetical protein
MPRTRSLLIDNTLGKIFTNTDTTAAADASKLIAGTKLVSASIVANKSVIAKVTNNLSGNPQGVRFVSGGLVTAVIMSAATASTGRAIAFTFKVGTTYETATTLGTDQLNVTVTRKNAAVAWTIPAGSSIYVDITQVGNVRPGAGVGVQFNFYAG